MYTTNDYRPNITGRLKREDGTYINLGDVTHAVYDVDEITTTTMANLKIKNGSSYVIGKVFTEVGTDEYALIYFVAGTKNCYINYNIVSDGAVLYGVNVDYTITGNGTAVPIINRSTNTNPSDCLVYHTPTYTSVGTTYVERMNSASGGAPAKGGESSGDPQTLILHPGEERLFMVQSNSATDQNINIILNWYEKAVS